MRQAPLRGGLAGVFARRNMADLIASAAIIGILVVMIAGLTTWLMSTLLALNICFSLIILLISFYILRPLDFSTFPSVLLIATVFRLALNVASTKLILSTYSGDPAMKAGAVINFFGRVVAGDDPIVGLVIFAILIIIQFVVITKGAGRVAEVAARFTLDAMPGKQMAIDADLNAGLINEQEAKSRRERIVEEADFYGSMDGASKFVRGDAIAGILITLINIVGGFVRGFMDELTVNQIFRAYTLLTIGDGLVSQIPALLVATSAGIVVTRTSGEKQTLGQNLGDQLMPHSSAMTVGAITIGLIALIGLAFPDTRGITLPFLIIFFLALGGAFFMRRQKQQIQRDEVEKEVEEREKQQPQEQIETLLHVDAMEIEIGYGLIPLVDVEQGGDLLERVSQIRRQVASDFGMIVPPIRIRDNMQLSPHEYQIRIKGVQVARGELKLDYYLAMNPSGVGEELPGEETTEPAFGLPARWISSDLRERAELMGYTVVEPAAVLATHLTEVIKRNAWELMGRQETQKLVDNLKETHPVVVNELVPDVLGLGLVQKVLQNLLRERVSIRDLASIFEALADNAPISKDVDYLTECARASLARKITQRHRSDDGKLYVITLDPAIEKMVADAVQKSPQGGYLALDAATAQQLIRGIKEQYDKAVSGGKEVVLLTNSQIRLYLRRVTERVLSGLNILSYNEISPDVQVINVGQVQLGRTSEKVSG
jgi:flagellar biosynthesis protein FlhA